MPAAVAIPLIYGASKVGEAVVQHRAAGKAMKTQQQGADRALGAARDAYTTQQGLYQSMLGGASNTLSRLSTPGGGAQFAASGPPVGQFSAPGMMPPQAQGMGGGQRPRLGAQEQPAMGVPSLGQMGAPGLHNYGGGGEVAGMPQVRGIVAPGIAGGGVLMRGPNGQPMQIPADQVGAAIQRGFLMPPGSPQSLAALGQVRM